MKTAIETFEDEALIKLALAGQPECFNTLIDRHTPAVRRRIKSMVGNTTDEDDLVQEVFLKAWRHLASFRCEASFRTWITRIAMNEVALLFRRERNSPLGPARVGLDTFASQYESPHQCFARSEARNTVHKALEGLPPKYRQVLILRDLSELSVRETAQLLQSSVPLVKTRLFRARLLLLAALKRTKPVTIRKREDAANPQVRNAA